MFEEVRLKNLTSSADHLVVSPEEELAQFEAAIALNDEWNAKIAVEREARLAKRLAERKEYILTRLELKEERDQLAREQAEELVRREKVTKFGAALLMLYLTHAMRFVFPIL